VNVPLAPRPPRLRKLQHKLVTRYHLETVSLGSEPLRHLVIYPLGAAVEPQPLESSGLDEAEPDLDEDEGADEDEGEDDADEDAGEVDGVLSGRTGAPHPGALPGGTP
jgi:hypothetical protein